VCKIGIGKNEFFKNIFNLKTCVSKIPISYEKNHQFKSKFYIEKPKFTLTDIGISRSYENIMEENTKLGVMATYMALSDAGFKLIKNGKKLTVNGLYNIDNSNIIIGVGMSSLQTAFESYLAHVSDNAPNGKEKSRFNRMVIPMLMPNSVSAWISIIYGIKGSNFTLNASCASGTIAIGEAFREIKNGVSDIAITGGVEALHDKNGAVMRGFDMLMTLTKSNDGIPMPFSKDRSGFLFNEGAGCILILEELDRAIKRGANIYAEIIDFENVSESYNIVQMETSGDVISSLIRKIISKDGNEIKIDYFNCHGTGTVQNDEIESNVIKDIFGDEKSQPYINSSKGILGHSIGASGALEAAITAYSIKSSFIHGNLTKNTIENLNLPISTIEADLNYTLSASYGFGGHNSILLFKKFGQ